MTKAFKNPDDVLRPLLCNDCTKFVAVRMLVVCVSAITFVVHAVHKSLISGNRRALNVKALTVAVVSQKIGSDISFRYLCHFGGVVVGSILLVAVDDPGTFLLASFGVFVTSIFEFSSLSTYCYRSASCLFVVVC